MWQHLYLNTSIVVTWYGIRPRISFFSRKSFCGDCIDIVKQTNLSLIWMMLLKKKIQNDLTSSFFYLKKALDVKSL